MKRQDFSITELKYPWKLTEMLGFCLDSRTSIWQIALSYQFKSSWWIWLLHSIHWNPNELKRCRCWYKKEKKVNKQNITKHITKSQPPYTTWQNNVIETFWLPVFIFHWKNMTTGGLWGDMIDLVLCYINQTLDAFQLFRTIGIKKFIHN